MKMIQSNNKKPRPLSIEELNKKIKHIKKENFLNQQIYNK